jgi:hypothetical protein
LALLVAGVHFALAPMAAAAMSVADTVRRRRICRRKAALGRRHDAQRATPTFEYPHRHFHAVETLMPLRSEVRAVSLHRPNG